MAVFTNLAIDCSFDEAMAVEWFRIYSDVKLATREFGRIDCDVEHIRPNRHWKQPNVYSDEAGDWHTLCVSPNGIGNGPLSDSLIDELRWQLYRPLRKGDGLSFRSAWFGWEAQDELGSIDWPATLEDVYRSGTVPEMPGLILSNEIINPDVESETLVPFCSGYRWYDPKQMKA